MKKRKEAFSSINILGIDLGNKGSGNTALCFLSKNKLHFNQIQKGEDEFRLNFKYNRKIFNQSCLY